MIGLFLFIGLSLSNDLFAQTRKIDSSAVSILDRMSSLLGSMNSLSVKTLTNYDIRNKALGLVKHSNIHELYLHGPNKLYISSQGDRGERQYYYNGKSLILYSSERNTYSEAKAPENLISMIDTMHTQYGMEFPAADFFYPRFVDDIIGESTTLMYLGMTHIDGQECFHIAGVTKDKSYQFWISNGAYYLPVKMVIIYTDKDLNPQFEENFKDWKINPEIPDALFEFAPPPLAKKIKLGIHKR